MIKYKKPHSPASYYSLLIEPIRSIAYDLGYAIGLHGSMQRDLDIIAVPWITSCASAERLAKDIAIAVDGLIADETNSGRPNPDGNGFVPFSADMRHKPHGRTVWTIIIGGGLFIDLSIMPRMRDWKPLRENETVIKSMENSNGK